ncbi:mannose-1-phosphate guanylyltransferase [Legionella geestiana]|uniref:mannose-1-phosphate guanylyltransferase n=1 Tax=Legionella geestiana TaxID=45065 RepID=A0A0W0TP48_9GAMM|nr:mannose-1-phosphate guanylyltransferase [Legionella geestiana]QBS12416.1 mannose-1-phosphate guanylyltransferase/mannose-6-phosphate isomerase [Legionella geestiana]QDQ39870.1 mannose-1-phosphate guanylyltransferase/mannose-6-phosphate isomerase [Legionella geestiana]STX55143.1 mannose-1-phosphate guanylyltransferase [Legionella geestiana]
MLKRGYPVAPLFPVILAGGSGTRLWPLSRTNYPKQFLRLNGLNSLIQATAARVGALNPDGLFVVSNEAHYFLCQEQLEGVNPVPFYLLEPGGRNTAPAIAASALAAAERGGEDALMLVLPSDHAIADTPAFTDAMQKALRFASTHDALVTFGMQPEYPATAYGYIGKAAACGEGVYAVSRFVEKPDRAQAERLLAGSDFLWNSGMLAVRAGVCLNALREHAPELLARAEDAFYQGQRHHDFLRLDKGAFAQCENASFDYAVLEKARDVVVVPASMGWSDLGCWRAVAEAGDTDASGNTLRGNVVAHNSRNCLIQSEETLVTTLGLQDHIVIATRDAVLVADKTHAQQVKDLVQTLSIDHHRFLHDPHRVTRPWGYYEVLAEGEAFKVKRLMVKPGARLSLQRHEHRAEHWVVVGGEAEVVNDSKTLRLGINQSTYIPKRTLHRLSNTREEPLFVIEVQSGNYLGEDDIERFDDAYCRSVLPG